MQRAYRNPSIVEAVCEMRFEPSQPWDWTIPGLFYAEVKGNFPEKQQHRVLDFELQAEQREIAQKIKGGVSRMQFFNEDRNALLQVGPDLLTINHLRPYPNWGTFRKMIMDAFEVYIKIAAPKGVSRIGLRYVNRIETNERKVKIEDYLLALPQVPDEVPQVFAKWVQRVEIPFESKNGLLLLQSGSVHEDNGKGVAFLLDLDFITIHPEDIQLDAVVNWIEQAHENVENTFESCITSKTRTLLEEVSINE